jgi:hypothetical protein
MALSSARTSPISPAGYHVVLSYEIYNEEDSRQWWDGTANEYAQTLREAARAVRAADPRLPVLLGGMTYPDTGWLRAITKAGVANYYDVTPFHAYPETWDPGTVENYLGAHYRSKFIPFVEHQKCGPKPIWINEMGYATTKGKTQPDQANWYARSFKHSLRAPGQPPGDGHDYHCRHRRARLRDIGQAGSALLSPVPAFGRQPGALRV